MRTSLRGVCAVAVALAPTRANARVSLVMGIAGLAIAGISAWVPYNARHHDRPRRPPMFARVAARRKPVTIRLPTTVRQSACGSRRLIRTLPHSSSRRRATKCWQPRRARLPRLGLELIEADAAQGQIEATATSVLFGWFCCNKPRLLRSVDEQRHRKEHERCGAEDAPSAALPDRSHAGVRALIRRLSGEPESSRRWPSAVSWLTTPPCIAGRSRCCLCRPGCFADADAASA